MLELFLIIFPLLCAVLILPAKNHLPRLVLPVVGIIHFTGCSLIVFGINRPLLPEWFRADFGIVPALIASALFLTASIHANMWLPAAAVFENKHGKQMRESYFCSLLLAFLAMMTLAAFSRNLGIFWVAVEATTLFSAPLIIFHRSATSLEAMWKYLLICSVGIGLALFGTYLLEVAFQQGGEEAPGLGLDKLAGLSDTVHPVWFKAAFIFCFAGYGLKMGLAPFHTWLPDAHSEAPSMVSLLLSGALLNCSFLGILRIISIAPDALKPFCYEILIAFGVFSLLTAAFFMIGQTDYKRLLAYSSVEHMGLIAIFAGLNNTGMLFLHMLFHSFCKMLLFLTAGNFLLAAGTRKIDSVRGMGHLMPRTSFLWIAGTLMICGMPPSPLFITEIGLVISAGPVLGCIVLLILFAVFAAMTYAAMKMTTGKTELIPPPDAVKTAEHLSLLPLVLLAVPVFAGCRLMFHMKGIL